MIPPGRAEPQVRLDVVQALRRALRLLAGDWAAVILAGLVLVTLPGMAARAMAPSADFDIVLTTLRGVLAMLFVALVSFGAGARASGRSLPPPDYWRQGLARALPGLKVALLMGCAVVTGLIVQLFARHGTLAGLVLDAALLAAGLWGLCAALPAVPAAVMENLPPAAAFRRAAALTDGNRNRVLALALVVGLALAPLLALALGMAGTGMAGTVAAWVIAAIELLAWSLAALVPAAVYAELKGVP
ncbi:hypothetical protein [Sandarakinorhabdus sp.]|uniref:hypothetical protein n=1 Tax=Sandarakinorhabdus sp. TaxID=1916663 RepID=UPI00286DE850|nr:hypothetical protein [Sandarakinorhabdus sp.]